MALSRKRKIIIAVSAVALLGIIVVVSIFARGKDEPELTVVKIDRAPNSALSLRHPAKSDRPVHQSDERSGGRTKIFSSPRRSWVTQGQPLVRPTPKQLQTQQEAQQAGVQIAVSDVQNARSAVLAAENNVAQERQGSSVAEGRTGAGAAVCRHRTTAVDREQVNLNAAQRELQAHDRTGRVRRRLAS